MNISANLLKLSDFPFSYSFIGGLFLILAGTSINFNDILTSEFAPLLAIMCLLGTALAISDPFGRLLKMLGIFLTKRDLPKWELEGSKAMELLPPEAKDMIKKFTSAKRLGRPLSRFEDRELRLIQLKIQRPMIDIEEELLLI